MGFAVAERENEPTAGAQLLNQRSGHLGRGRRDKDRVVRGVRAPSERPVAHEYRDVTDPDGVQDRLGGLGERGNPLDGKDLLGTMPQQGRLVTGAGSDLQDAFMASQGGYEYVLLFGVATFFIAIRGGGPYSVDRAIGKEL